MSRDPSPVVFVVPGDLHLTEPGLDNHRAACSMIDEVNRLIQPDFVQFIGDNVQHATDEQYRLFRQLASQLKVPQYALVGDHDLDKNKSFDRFVDYVGDPYGSTELRNIRFIRLNSQEHRPVGFSEDQLDWLESEFDAANANRQQVVLFQHNYPFQIWEDFAGPGVERWRCLVQTRPVAAIICGHTHYLQTANDGHNVSIAVRSIGDPEGGAPGYLIGYAQGDDLAVKYRTTDDCGPVAMITHPRNVLLATHARHIVHAADEVRVRTWSPEPLRKVQYKLDDGRTIDMPSISGNDWFAPLAEGGLTKGEHQLDVLAIGPLGDVVATDSLTFMFDPTNRYTPVPMVRPVVKETTFC
jgi:3',5'-cyclic AMP phosphodiesterase CpdA